jgi:ribosomal subunit interface protein
MQLHFKGSNYEITPEISAHATKKFNAIAKHLGKGKDTAFAYIDLGKETDAHQNGRIWYADINLEWEGQKFYAKAVEETLENAVDRAVNELKGAVHTARKRKISLARRGGALFKSFIQGFGS